MTSHQVVFLFLDLAVIIIVARLLGAVARRLGQPRVIGEVLAGILLGPSLFGAAFSATVFPADIRPFLSALGNIGVAMFMFVVGLELERTLLRGQGRLTATVSLSAVLLPFGLGIALAFALTGNHPTEHRLGFVLFVGAAMSATAFPVLARILGDRRMQHTRLGGLALACAAIDDVLVWSLLAVVVVLSGNAGTEQWLTALLPVYVALMFWGVRPLLRRLFARGAQPVPALLAVVLAGALLSGAATEFLGLHFIFGAFLFGVVFPEGTAELREAILGRVTEFNGALLLPVFFVATGLKVDLGGIGAVGFAELGLVLVVAVAGKVGGTFVGARLGGLPARESATMGALMNTRGLTELIILSAGLQFGLLDQPLYSIMVAMAVITTAMTGPLLNLLYPEHLVERDRNADARRDGAVLAVEGPDRG